MPIKSKALSSMGDSVQKIPEYFSSIQEKPPPSYTYDNEGLGKEKSMPGQF